MNKLPLLIFTFSALVLASASPIRESELRAHIKFLSDDLLEGRGTGARGGEVAARYIATRLEGLGVKGAAENGSFFQPVSLVGVKADSGTVLTVKGDNGEANFHFGDEFVAFTGAQAPKISVAADLVFVGYGIEAPEERWNDFKGPADDYRGKILVILVNDPPATVAEPNLFGGKALTYKGRWTYKFEEAARRGAAGALLLHTDETAGYPWSVVRTSNGSWHFDVARATGDNTPWLPLRAWMTDPAAHHLFSLAGKNLDELRKQAASRDFKPVALGLKGTIELNSEVAKVEAPNVVGILPGRDPSLKKQVVIFSGHWDHLGIGEPDKNGDRIYNGAVDNASGVAAVLEIASAFSRLPPRARPRRSVLFLFPTAEEQGLLGSDWYVHHPAVPLADTVADLNLDALNILGPTHDMIALGMRRSHLAKWIETVAKARKLHLSSDPRPEQGSFFRSDHFPFAKAGVPAINISEGNDYVGHPEGWGTEQFKIFNEQHYHQPSDEYRASWNFAGMVQETEFTFAIGQALADSPGRPHGVALD